jgi:hypothetical protein
VLVIYICFSPFQYTHYGESFEVVDKPGPSNVAYTGKTLGLHLDQPILKNSPEIQWLHCIKQFEMEGGENEFADGFRKAICHV